MGYLEKANTFLMGNRDDLSQFARVEYRLYVSKVSRISQNMPSNDKKSFCRGGLYYFAALRLGPCDRLLQKKMVAKIKRSQGSLMVKRVRQSYEYNIRLRSGRKTFTPIFPITWRRDCLRLLRIGDADYFKLIWMFLRESGICAASVARSQHNRTNRSFTDTFHQLVLYHIN
jgi:hypothetical protein